MTSWTNARTGWKKWSQVPPDAQRDLLWAWKWCRTCSMRDVVMEWYWLSMGAEGGLPAFLAHEEPVWTVELLRLCYPAANLADLEHAAGLFFGIPGGAIAKRRTLREGGKSAGWIAECERHAKSDIKERESTRGDWSVLPWSAAALAWMASPMSLARVDPAPVGPWKVTRWAKEEGLAWTAHYEGQPGFIRKAYGGGPQVDPRILSELDGWEPPGFPALDRVRPDANL